MINDNTLELEFIYSIDVVVTGMKELRDSVSIFSTILPWLALCLCIGTIVSWFILPGPPTEASTLSFIIFFVLFIDPFLKRSRIKKNFRKNPSADCLVKYTISDKGVGMYEEGANSFTNWSKIFRVERRYKGILIFFNTNTGHWIPIEMISKDEIKFLENIIKENGINYKAVSP